MVKRVTFSKEFKIEAVRILDLGKKSAVGLALEPCQRRNQLCKWKEQRSKKTEAPFRGPRRKSLSEESEVARLVPGDGVLACSLSASPRVSRPSCLTRAS